MVPGFDTCSPNPCATAACCFPPDCSVTTRWECEANGGEYFANQSTCDPDPCIAACCTPPHCTLTTRWGCEAIAGEYLENIPDCDLNLCLVTVNACCIDSTCEVLTNSECELRGGEFFLGVESCDPDVCTMPSDRNLNNGAFIVHAPSGIQWTSTEDWCARYDADLGIQDPAEQRVRIDPPPDESRMLYVLTAWDKAKDWSGVQFGLGAYDPGRILISDWGLCGEQALETTTAGWPGPNEGTMLASPVPWSGNCRAVYWFAAYAYGSDKLPLGVHPNMGTAGYLNCDPSPAYFSAQCLGELGVYQPGRSCYPGPPVQYACCFEGAECLVLTIAECLYYGGNPQEHIFACDPEPCTETHVCCVSDDCYVYTAIQCENLQQFRECGCPWGRVHRHPSSGSDLCRG